MSAIREAIAAELEEARAAAEKALDRVQQLEELDAQATQLDDGEASAAAPPSAAAPAPPRRKTSTSAGRRPAPAKAASPAPSGQAHTASGAPTGGRRSTYQADELLPKVRRVFVGLDEPISVSEICRRLELPPKSDRALNAVRGAVSTMLTEQAIRQAGTGRGGHPNYEAVARGPERAIPAGVPRPSATTPAASNPIDRAVDEIVHQIALDGGRVARQDLRNRIGDYVSFEDFDLAVDRAVNLGRIIKTKAGGVVGYELAR